MEEDAPLEAREHRKGPAHFTRNRNNDTTKAVMVDVRMEEECIPGIVKESTVWDVYNNEARKVDNELVKDWTASLNLLLVFAAIFAAVLTAFIIESKKMLQPDQTEILVDIAMQYFNNIGNQSRNNLTRPDFEPTSAAIAINCLFFSSLGASLVAALASVVALQWVADYDAAITRGGSSPEDRAKRRQFRHSGVVGWKMGEIIAALPILLYSSVILFWAGAIQWMWTLHHTVGYVVVGGTAVAVLFYASTTVLAAAYVSAPFRTPLSRGLYWLIGPSASTIRRLISWLPFQNILRRAAPLLGVPWVSSLSGGGVVSQWINKHFIPEDTCRHREDKAAGQDPSVVSEALSWLARQLPISGDSHERLLLCASGILALSTDNTPSSRFHDAPWLAILDILSEHFMCQILNPMSSENDYQGVGMLLHCIGSPSIRTKVVPAESYIQDPRDTEYWSQCSLEEHGILYFDEIRSTPMTFLFARDVPVPSLGSKYELEATWKLIKWRNSMSFRELVHALRNDVVWPEVFSDIGRYSPEFLESCLCHFRTWTNVLRYRAVRPSGYPVMFTSIMEQALRRDLTIGEALALLRAFAGYLTALRRYRSSETADETNIIPQPLLYTLAVGLSSEETRATHLAITLLVVRATRSSVVRGWLQWARWITLMLWISIPKEPGYLDALAKSIVDNKETRNVWDEIEMTSTGVAIESPHVEEIARILWRVDNVVMESLSRDAFEDPQSLASDTLLSRVPLTPPRGSQHILLHLYQAAATTVPGIYAGFHTGLVCLEGVDWTRQRFNPITAMLALSDTQDAACLEFNGPVDFYCAGRILEIVKAVKRQPIAFLCLLTDIFTMRYLYLRPMDLVIILEAVKQAMAFIEVESATPFLRPLASGCVGRVWVFKDDFLDNNPQYRAIEVEVQRTCYLLQAKYAASLITSNAQLQLMFCARSAAVAQPAMGWLRMHEPL